MADTDTIIFISIVTAFIILGAVLPFVNSDFDQTETGTYNVQGVSDDLGQQEYGGTPDIIDVLISVFKMFFWTFGDLPALVDVFMLVPRIALLVIIAKWVRGV